MLPSEYSHHPVGICCTLGHTYHYGKRRAVACISCMEARLWVQNFPWLKTNSFCGFESQTLWRHKVIIVFWVASVWSNGSHVVERLHWFFNLPVRSTCWSSPCKIVSIGQNHSSCSMRVRTANPSMQKPIGVTCSTIAICRETITIHVLKDVTCKSGLA